MRPTDDETITTIVKGYGRVKSVLAWNDTSPVERLKMALMRYRGEGSGGDQVKKGNAGSYH